MSYSENLWDKFELIRKNAQNQKKYFEEFIDVINQRVQLEETYQNGLIKINQVLQEHMQEEGIFANIISALKSDQANRAQTCGQIINSLNVEVIEKAQVILEEQNNSQKTILSEGKKLEKDCQNLLSNLDKTKSKYLQLEKSYQNQYVSSEIIYACTDIPNDKKLKTKQKLDVSFKEAQDSEQAYKYWVTELNTFLKGYKKDMSEIMGKFQDQEKQRLEQLYDCVRKCLIFEMQQVKSIEYDCNTIFELTNQIDIDKSIQEYIVKNTSQRKELDHIQFKKYVTFQTKSLQNTKKLELSQNTRQNYLYIQESIRKSELDWNKIEAFNEINNKIDPKNEQLQIKLDNSRFLIEEFDTFIFQEIIKTGPKKQQEEDKGQKNDNNNESDSKNNNSEENESKIENSNNNEQNQQNSPQKDQDTYQLQELSEEQVQRFGKQVQNNESLKRVCVKILEAYRSKNRFTLNEIPFNCLSRVFLTLLDQCLKEKDTYTARKLLTLSFYYTLNAKHTSSFSSNNDGKEKISLLQSIENHPIWRVRELWEGIVYESIFEELKIQKKLNIEKKEMMNDTILREKNIIVSQLALHAQYMLNLNVRKRETKDIINKFAKYFQLSDEQIKEIGLSMDAFMANKKERNGSSESSSVMDESPAISKSQIVSNNKSQSQISSFKNFTQSTIRY